MANRIFENIIKEKIDFFKFSFCENSKNIFINEEGKLIHPGEFGVYRENIVKNILKLFIPQNFDIESGFILTDKGNISTQVDLIIYDKNLTPLIENFEKQKFIPVDTVGAIIEIKSDLNKSQLKTALNKIAKNKKLKSEISSPYIVNKTNKTDFNPEKNPYDTIFSILICNKLNFNYENIVNELDELYEPNIECIYKHNIIFSIEDGIFGYYDERDRLFAYPIKKFKNIHFKPINEYSHFNLLFHNLYNALSSVSISSIEIAQYIGESSFESIRIHQK